MFEAYRISVVLQMNNLISAELMRVGQDFKQAEAFSASLRASLKATTQEAKGLAAALRSVYGVPSGRSAAAAAANESTAAFTRASAAAQKYTADLNKLHGAAVTSARPSPVFVPPAMPPSVAAYSQGSLAQQSYMAAGHEDQSGLVPPILMARRPAQAKHLQETPISMQTSPIVSAYPSAVLASSGQGGSIPPILALPARGGAAGGSGGGMPYTPYTMRTPGGGGSVPPGGGGGFVAPGAGGQGGGGRGGFHGGNIHLGPNGIGIGAVGMSAGSGILPLVGAAGSVYAGKALYESARDYETARTRFKTLNLGEKANQEADLFARRTQVTGVSSIQLMETLRESVGLFGSLPNAMKVAPMVAQLNAANSNLFGGKIGAIDETAVRAVFRFNDMRGRTNSPEDFLGGLDVMQKLVTGSGGAIQFRDAEQFAKRGGVAFKSLSDEGLLMYATIMQEKGGAAAGTGTMSMYQNLVAGRTTKKAMAAMEAAGLVTLGTVETGTVGGKKSKSTVVRSVLDEEMLRENQGGWIIKYGLPAALRMGDKSDAQIAARINSWLPNRVGSDNAVSFGTQHLQVLRDRNMTAGAAGYAQTIALQQKTLGGNQGEFIAAWTNFKTEFGMSALPAFSKLLTNGSSFLREVNIFMESPAVKSFVSTYQRGFDMQGSALSKTANTLFGAKPGAQEVRTGAAVTGNDTGGGAFTGYRSPIRTSNAGAGRGMINNVIVMPNGRELARVVTQEQGKELNRPQTGPRTADGRQSLRAFDTERGG